MDEAIHRALATSGLIDLTTTGRRSGRPRRIEIYLHALDERLYISGMPIADRTRAWLLNAEAHPAVIIHLKRGIEADIAGTARVITGESERRAVLAGVARNWGRTDLETMVAHSPLIEVVVPGYPA